MWTKKGWKNTCVNSIERKSWAQLLVVCSSKNGYSFVGFVPNTMCALHQRIGKIDPWCLMTREEGKLEIIFKSLTDHNSSQNFCENKFCQKITNL